MPKLGLHLTAANGVTIQVDLTSHRQFTTISHIRRAALAYLIRHPADTQRFNMKYSYIVVMIGVLIGTVQTAQATCVCACVEGIERTLCDDLTEANAGENLCLDGRMATNRHVFTTAAQWACPEPVGAIDPAISEPIPAGAENCLRVRIYDPVTRDYSDERNICGFAS